jgi:magnesium transporter
LIISLPMNIESLSLHFLRDHPRDAARTLEKFEVDALSAYLAQLPVKSAAGVVQYIVPTIASVCLESMPHERAAAIIMHLDIERAAALLRRIQEVNREKLIRATSTIFANMVRLVMRYPEGTIGQVMDPDIFTVHQDMRVTEVITAVRNAEKQLQHEIFVINDRLRPVGIVAVKQLLISGGKEMMKNIMHPVGTTLAARTSLSVVQNSVEWEHRDSIPVVDHQNVLIGLLHRRSLLTGTENKSSEEYATTALAVAELFWDTCAHLLLPMQNNDNKGAQDERND